MILEQIRIGEFTIIRKSSLNVLILTRSLLLLNASSCLDKIGVETKENDESEAAALHGTRFENTLILALVLSKYQLNF